MDVIIERYVVNVVLVSHLLGYMFDKDLHVLKLGHCIVQVVVFNVSCYVSGNF